jgi:hypothetical protein
MPPETPSRAASMTACSGIAIPVAGLEQAAGHARAEQATRNMQKKARTFPLLSGNPSSSRTAPCLEFQRRQKRVQQRHAARPRARCARRPRPGRRFGKGRAPPRSGNRAGWPRPAGAWSLRGSGAGADRQGTPPGRCPPRPASRAAGRSARPRILAHVAGDVGQLHRHAQIAGPRQRIGVAHAHQHGHHRAHRRRHPRGIGVQVRQRPIRRPIASQAKPSSSASGRARGISNSSIIAAKARSAGVLRGGPRRHRSSRSRSAARPPASPRSGPPHRRPAGRRHKAPAPGRAHGRQQARGGVERQRPVADRLFAMGHVGGIDHSAAAFIAGAAGGASGTSFASTSAEAMTPGSPRRDGCPRRPGRGPAVPRTRCAAGTRPIAGCAARSRSPSHGGQVAVAEIQRRVGQRGREVIAPAPAAADPPAPSAPARGRAPPRSAQSTPLSKPRCGTGDSA